MLDCKTNSNNATNLNANPKIMNANQTNVRLKYKTYIKAKRSNEYKATKSTDCKHKTYMQNINSSKTKINEYQT